MSGDGGEAERDERGEAEKEVRGKRSGVIEEWGEGGTIYL